MPVSGIWIVIDLILNIYVVKFGQFMDSSGENNIDKQHMDGKSLSNKVRARWTLFYVVIPTTL